MRVPHDLDGVQGFRCLDVASERSDSSRVDALETVLPKVAQRCPRVSLGIWPTPIHPLNGVGRAAVYIKREDQSSPIYGGNKIRCLETTFAQCLEQGIRRVWGIGAWGSNQAVAIALHGPRVGFRTGALLVPQPPSVAAADNLAVTVGAVDALRLQRSLVSAPWAYLRLWSRRRAADDALIAPGAANPVGAIGHLAAALEVERRDRDVW